MPKVRNYGYFPQRHLVNIVMRIETKTTMTVAYIVNSLTTRETKLAEFANSVDLNEVAHNEPLHLDLHCLPCSL